MHFIFLYILPQTLLFYIKKYNTHIHHNMYMHFIYRKQVNEHEMSI